MKSFPKSKETPNFRTPTHNVDPESYDRRSVRFRLDLLDFDHELWGWESLTSGEHLEVLRFLHNIEKQTWAEIKLAAGGRKKGTNHHSLEVCQFNKIAQDRIRSRNLEKVIGDTLFSFRVNNCTRLYGLREGEYFRMIWHDPYHCDHKKAVYPCGS